MRGQAGMWLDRFAPARATRTLDLAQKRQAQRRNGAWQRNRQDDAPAAAAAETTAPRVHAKRDHGVASRCIGSSRAPVRRYRRRLRSQRSVDKGVDGCRPGPLLNLPAPPRASRKASHSSPVSVAAPAWNRQYSQRRSSFDTPQERRIVALLFQGRAKDRQFTDGLARRRDADADAAATTRTPQNQDQ